MNKRLNIIRKCAIGMITRTWAGYLGKHDVLTSKAIPFASCILWLWALAFSVPAIAQQSSLRHLTLQNIAIKDGLSQGMVNAILQDRFGFMWFATKDGLNKYDGYSFTVYRHSPEDVNSLANSYVQSLYEDKNGRMWVGTVSGEVELFDQSTGRFHQMAGNTRGKTEAPPGQVYQFIEDAQGNIWALRHQDVVVITPQKSAITKRETFTVSTRSIPFPGPMPFLYKDPKGNIFHCERHRTNLYAFNRESNGWVSHDAFSTLVGGKETKENTFPLAILEDGKRKRSFFIFTDGVYRLNKDSGISQILKRPLQSHLNFRLDEDGNLCFIDQGKLLYLETATGMLTMYPTSDPFIKMKLDLVSSAYFDNAGLLWAGTRGYGLMAINMRALHFQHTDNVSIFDFMQQKDGSILVNNGNDSYKLFDPVLAEYKKIIPVGKGARYFDRFTEFNQPLYHDALNRKWVADEKKLYCYDPRDQSVKSYVLPVDLSNNVYGSVLEIVADGNGFLWAGTSGGLVSFNEATASWRVYQNDPGDSTSLSFNAIYCLLNDPEQPKRYLWIGTNGGGLNRLDITTGKFHRYTEKDGLPNNVVYGILPDNDNRLWMSTNKGLSCFTPTTQSFRNYNEGDGLQSDEFNHNAYMRTSNGILYFGGINGFNYFDPRQIRDNPHVPQVVLTGLRIHNKPILVNGANSPVETAIYMAKSITVPYSDNMITFEFAAMDFSAPKRNQYKYKLDGFNDDWVEAGNTNSATYTNLDPGSYTFHVLGSNKDGVWNESGHTIVLTIRPPWYFTWWFKTLLILSVAGVFYAFYRYRLQQALALMSVRNRIASDLHDEIGSNLSNISIFSNVARQPNTPPNQVDHILGRISDFSQSSMEAMSDIVWMINADNDNFENILMRMRSLASELFEATGCKLHIKFDEKLNALKLGMDERKNFYLIFKEAVNNIAKYAKCSDVWIDTSLSGKGIILQIRDNGMGFDKSEIKHGNGLTNMKTRAAALKGNLCLTSTPGKGTSVELWFPL